MAILPEDQPITLLTSVHPQIKCCLVYAPGSNVAQSISDASFHEPRCAGNFISFIGEQDRNEIKTFEDGFGIMLNGERWMQVRRALQDRTPLTIAASGSFPGLEIEWGLFR